jgi:FkbM family methyltransferase
MRKLFHHRSTLDFSDEVAQAPTVRHTYAGVPLEVTMADEVSFAWYDVDWPEVPEVDFLVRHGIGSGATVFDLGAHQSVYALLFAHRVGPSGRVLAVEANAHNADVSRRNRQLNGVGNLEILHAAVAEQRGTVSFGRGLNGSIGAFEDSATVDAVTIDDLSVRHGPADLLFLDIEGFEVRALHGARATLARRPAAFVEVHVGEGLEDAGDSADDLLAFFPSSAYDRYLSDEEQRHPQPFTEHAYRQMKQRRFFLTAIPRRTT